MFVITAEEGLQSEDLEGLADLDGARVSEELDKILTLEKNLRYLEGLFPPDWPPIRQVSDDIAKLAGAPRPKHGNVCMEQRWKRNFGSLTFFRFRRWPATSRC